MRRGSYFGCCFAGVYEYVYPFKNCKGDVIGFISVSGYRRDFKQPPRRLDAVARKYVFNAPRLKEIYMSSLSPVIPPKADIDRLIHPLADMLELLMIKTIGTRPKAQKSKYSAYVEILLYLREHYAENISIKLLSEKFHYSPSYISHLFKSFNGFSIRCCVNEIRLEYAKNYLINTDLPVSNIAFNLGYMDPNYFSKVYKKKYGISPLRERDRAIKNEKNT